MKRFLLVVLLALVGFYVAWPAFTGYRIHQGLEANDAGTLAAKIDFPSVRRSMREPVLNQVNKRIEAVMKDFGPATKLVADQIPRQNIEKIVDGALATVVTPEKVTEAYSNGMNFNAVIQQAVLGEIDKMGGMAAVLNLGQAIAKTSDETAGDKKDQGMTIGGFKVPGKIGALLENKDVKDALGGLVGQLSLDSKKVAELLFPNAGAGSTGGEAASFGLSNIKSFEFAGPTAFEVGIARNAEAALADVTAEMSFKNYDWRVTKLTPNLIDR